MSRNGAAGGNVRKSRSSSQLSVVTDFLKDSDRYAAYVRLRESCRDMTETLKYIPGLTRIGVKAAAIQTVWSHEYHPPLSIGFTGPGSHGLVPFTANDRTLLWCWKSSSDQSIDPWPAADSVVRRAPPGSAVTEQFFEDIARKEAFIAAYCSTDRNLAETVRLYCPALDAGKAYESIVARYRGADGLSLGLLLDDSVPLSESTLSLEQKVLLQNWDYNDGWGAHAAYERGEYANPEISNAFDTAYNPTPQDGVPGTKCPFPDGTLIGAAPSVEQSQEGVQARWRPW